MDKAEFVLAFDPSGSRDMETLTARNRAFADYIERALAYASGDPALSAARQFVTDDEQKARCIAELGGRAEPNDSFAFRFEGDNIHDLHSVRSAWKAIRSETPGTGRAEATCLVCGQNSVPVRLHPQIKKVPGGTPSGISVVSYNSPAFESFEMVGNENAPICQACSEAYSKGLNRLFHPEYPNPKGGSVPTLPKRHFRLSSDTTVLYWASGADEHKFLNRFGYLDFVDPARAGALFEAVDQGKGVLKKDDSPFFALIVTGGQGRATLRGYFQSTVGEVAEKLRAYFDDIEIVRRYENSPRWPPLSWLVRSLAAQGEYKNVDPDLAGRLFLAILDGSPFPAAVLAKAVGRIRTEREDPNRGRHKHSREQLALIRATLNRQFNKREGEYRIKSLILKEVSVMLDPDCTSNAYCLGRLLAVLEKLQGDAIGNPGASIVDRFYGAASATPAAVFAPLLRKAQHHQAKLDGAYYPRLIQEILDLLPAEAFPSTLNLEEQGLFALGYYHQKAALWRGKPKPQDVAATAE